MVGWIIAECDGICNSLLNRVFASWQRHSFEGVILISRIKPLGGIQLLTPIELLVRVDRLSKLSNTTTYSCYPHRSPAARKCFALFFSALLLLAP